MNHIYRSIWSEAFNTWIAVSELTTGKSKTKNTSVYAKSSVQTECNNFSYCSKTAKVILLPPLILFSITASALPTGNELVAGQATVTTPTATQMQINQSSNRAVINWQGFSVGQNEAVNIQQPNAQAALLNRVVGQDASQIQGKLQANGQVYLVNPNGVVFSKTAQVDVGGLIATTHNISNADFMAGKNHFTQDGAKGTVENYGTINTPNGGVVALIGESVTNTGTINTPKGTTALAAGKTVDLDFQGNGLVEVKVTEAALNAQITNKGAIQADGGRVVLTAKAAGQLIDTVINQEGIVQAQGLIEHNGEIILDGGNSGTVKVSGTLDTGNPNPGLNANGNINLTGQQIAIQNGAKLNASGKTGGGTITIGDKQITQQTTIEQGATVSAQTLDSGKAGTINVLANMDNGLVKVDGLLDASAPKNGDGGFIDTSAAHVKVADSAKISTKATNGNTGTWLIDPKDYTIAASGGDITGTTLSSNLGNTSVTIASIAGANGVNGDVNVNDAVSWSANKLTLNAQRNININANLNGSGAAKLALQYGQASAGGGANDNYFFNGAKINLSAGQNFSTKKGSTGKVKNYTVITSLGTAGSTTATTLQGMNANVAGNYALGADINASVTSSWNGGAGFKQVGTGVAPFTGNFDGLGHTITGLYINRPTTLEIGLFGWTNSSSSISNIGLVGGSVTGLNSVGGLVGLNAATINNVYTTGSVNGTNGVGGLVGNNGGIINNAYATGRVTGSDDVGGLVGVNNYTVKNAINNAYATGIVSGLNTVGGLVGYNYGGNINNVYATGVVSSTGLGGGAGGLVGYNGATIGGPRGNINNAYATGSVSGVGAIGITSSVGGLVGVNADSTINNAYATGSVSNTGPSDFVGGLVGNTKGTGITTNSFWNTQTTGQSTSAGGTGLTTDQMKQLNTFTNWSISNTGGSSAVWRIYEGQSTPLLRSFLTPLTVTADNASKTYDGQTYTGTLNNFVYSVAGADNSGHIFNLNAPYVNAVNVGTYAYTLPNLYSDQQGYDISQTNGVLTINPAILNTYGTRAYDGTVKVDANILMLNGLVNGETLNLSGIGTIADKNVGSNKTVNLGSLALSNGTGLASNYTFTGGTHKASVTPAILNLSGTRVYDGTRTVSANILNLNGLVNGETLNLNGNGTFLVNNVTDNKTVFLGTLALSNGTGLASNYTLTGGTHKANVTPAILNLSGTRPYDGTVNVNANIFTLSGLVNSETLNLTGIGIVADKNIGINKTVNLGSLALNNGIGIASNYTLLGGIHKTTITPVITNPNNSINTITTPVTNTPSTTTNQENTANTSVTLVTNPTVLVTNQNGAVTNATNEQTTVFFGNNVGQTNTPIVQIDEPEILNGGMNVPNSNCTGGSCSAVNMENELHKIEGKLTQDFNKDVDKFINSFKGQLLTPPLSFMDEELELVYGTAKIPIVKIAGNTVDALSLLEYFGQGQYDEAKDKISQMIATKLIPQLGILFTMIDITSGISDILESGLEGAAFRNVRTLLLSDNAKIIDGKPSIDSLTLLGDSNALRKGNNSQHIEEMVKTGLLTEIKISLAETYYQLTPKGALAMYVKENPPKNTAYFWQSPSYTYEGIESNQALLNDISRALYSSR